MKYRFDIIPPEQGGDIWGVTLVKEELHKDVCRENIAVYPDRESADKARDYFEALLPQYQRSVSRITDVSFGDYLLGREETPALDRLATSVTLVAEDNIRLDRQVIKLQEDLSKQASRERKLNEALAEAISDLEKLEEENSSLRGQIRQLEEQLDKAVYELNTTKLAINTALNPQGK